MNKKEKILLEYAILAPSSHNSQPWLFRVKENTVELLLNKEKLLAQADKDNRQAIISLGCALKNVELAANAYQLKIKIDRQLKDGLIAVIGIEGQLKEPTMEGQKVLNAIKSRQNNRSLYQNRDLDSKFKGWLNTFNKKDIKVLLTEDIGLKRGLSDIVLTAVEAAFGDKQFTNELSFWIKPSFKKYKEGLIGSNLGMPFVVSLLMPFMIRKFGLAKMQVKMHQEMLVNTPAMAVIATKGDEALDWLMAGEFYEELAVMAEKEGLATAALAAPIEIGYFYKDFQKILATDFRPQLFFRIGYPTKVFPKAPRRPLEECLVS